MSNATFTAAQEALLDTQQLVELVGVISTYAMVSRFLVGDALLPIWIGARAMISTRALTPSDAPQYR